MKRRYAAIVTMKDDDHEWDVVIYRDYKSIKEAATAIRRFKLVYGDMVVKARIEQGGRP